MKYLLAAATDVGNRKKTNQDSVLIKRAVCNDEQVVLAVLCDGMGGLSKGEVASASVITAFSKWFEREFPQFAGALDSENEILRSWDRLIKEMNLKLAEYGRHNMARLGTTITAMLFFQEVYYIAHVGDSRAYELSSSIVQLTKDQTLVQQEIDKGILTPQQAETDPRRSVLLQCIGASETVEPAYMKGKIKKDAVYLLCCDGFRHVISAEEILRFFYYDEMSEEVLMKNRIEEAIEIIKSRGEQDNISAIVIRTW